VFRLRGRGFPPGPGLARGDAHVRISVETPVNVSDDARALLQKLEGLLDDETLPRRRSFREATRAAAARTSGPKDP